MRLSLPTRPAAFGTAVASVIGPGTFNALLIVCAVTGTGPQLWYGEMSSYGSGTETRYGTAVPVQSRLDSVFPPDVDEKNVVATVPAKKSTWPFVAVTAAVVAGDSFERPRYTWLRESAYAS